MSACQKASVCPCLMLFSDFAVPDIVFTAKFATAGYHPKIDMVIGSKPAVFLRNKSIISGLIKTPKNANSPFLH